MKEQTMMSIGKVDVVKTDFFTEDGERYQPTQVEFRWIEKSPDHWYSDENIEVDVSKEDAALLIQSLVSAYGEEILPF